MVWFLVDDNLASHRKATDAGNPAMGLWVLAGAWSAGNLTDGFVPVKIARRLGTKSHADRLVNCGLWSRVTDGVTPGYQFHDWNDCQPTAEQVKQRREDMRQRKRRQRDRDGKPLDVTPGLTQDTHARGRPSPLKDLGSLTHQGDGGALRSGAPPQSPPEKKPANGANDFYDRLEMENCTLCDNDGRKPNGMICDHIDRTETYKNGKAAVKAALTKKPQPL